MGKDIGSVEQMPIDWTQVNVPLKSFSKGLSKIQVFINNIKKIAIEIFEIIRDTLEATPLVPLISKINTFGSDLEKVFNIINCTPFICIFGSYLRPIIGKIQIVAGLIVATVGEIGLLVSTEENPLNKKWQALSKLGTEHVIHGCLNVLRGLGEAFVSTFTMSLGNLVLVIPNLKKEFGPYSFGYGTLVDPLLNDEKKPENTLHHLDPILPPLAPAVASFIPILPPLIK